MLDETLCQEYPKTRSLKNGKQLTVRLLEATDVEALYIFFQSISREDRIFLKDDIREKNLQISSLIFTSILPYAPGQSWPPLITLYNHTSFVVSREE